MHIGQYRLAVGRTGRGNTAVPRTTEVIVGEQGVDHHRIATGRPVICYGHFRAYLAAGDPREQFCHTAFRQRCQLYTVVWLPLRFTPGGHDHHRMSTGAADQEFNHRRRSVVDQVEVIDDDNDR
ncbi:hypothetical protein [Nocardia sp. NPDC051570]|uniref:hypothetical protein n=1 Tax=Nocardia sp. NPDC051570 TaxID=3364324 RepID=UPI00379C6832